MANDHSAHAGIAVPAPEEVAFYVPDGPVEFLWGQRLEGELFRILTIPHITHEVALDDVVETFDDPELHFVRLVRQSGHSTLRVWVAPELEADSFLAYLVGLGCADVPMSNERFFALDVPAETDITLVLDYLGDGQDADRSDWEVGSISHLHGQELRTVMDPETIPDWVPRV